MIVHLNLKFKLKSSCRGVVHGALGAVRDGLREVGAVPAHVAVFRGDRQHLPVVMREPLETFRVYVLRRFKRRIKAF